MTEDLIKLLLKSNKGGTYDSHYGPTKVGDSIEIIEVWTQQSSVFETRFIVKEADIPPQYHAQFQNLCTYLDRKYDDLARKLLESASDSAKNRETREHRIRIIILAVAAFAFLSCVASLIIFIALEKPLTASGYVLLGGIISSGATLFFGIWRTPPLRSSTNSNALRDGSTPPPRTENGSVIS